MGTKGDLQFRQLSLIYHQARKSQTETDSQIIDIYVALIRLRLRLLRLRRIATATVQPHHSRAAEQGHGFVVFQKKNATITRRYAETVRKI